MSDSPDLLWAPWRLEYVLGPKRPDGCFLCACARSDEDDRNLVLARGAASFAVLNLHPYNNGHALIAPYEHSGDLERLAPSTLADMVAMLQRLLGAERRALAPDGFNVGFNLGKAAGAGVDDHVHLHVVPRWNGDTNFMTTLSSARVIPQSLAACHRILVENLGS